MSVLALAFFPMSQEEFEKSVIRDQLIIGLIGLVLFLALVLYGFKLILEL